MFCLEGWTLPGGAHTTFPCKFCPEKNFSALVVHVHPLHPLATPMNLKPTNLLVSNAVNAAMTQARRQHVRWYCV